MKIFCIVIDNNDISEKGFKTLRESSEKVKNNFDICKYQAVIPNQVEFLMEFHELKWDWTWNKTLIHEKTGLQQHPYSVKNKNKKIACSLSHYLLWKKCYEENEEFLILEHDSIFIQKLDLDLILTSEYDIVGINSPYGTTRLPRKFDQIVKKSNKNILPVPKIDNDRVPQGLAGNSAYILKPNGAKNLLKAVNNFGLWHNDAIMCKQLIPNMGVTKTYYTKVQGLVSTTSQ